MVAVEKKWNKLVSRPMLPLTMNLMGSGFDRVHELMGEEFPFSCKFDIIETTVLATNALISEDCIQTISEIILKRLPKDKDFLRKIFDNGMWASDNLIKVAEKLGKSDLKSLSNKQLAERFKTYVNGFREITPALYVPFAVEVLLTDGVKAKIRQLNPSFSGAQVDDYFRGLTVVQKDSDTFLEQKDMLEIALLQDKKMAKERLTQHAEHFGYMGLTNSFLSEPCDVAYFEQVFAQLQDPAEKLRGLIDNRAKELNNYKSFVEGMDAELIAEAGLLQDFMFFRAYRIDAIKKSQWLVRPLLEEICTRCNIKFEDIVCFMWPEVIKLLEAGDVPDFEPRKKNFTAGVIDNEIFWNTDPIRAEESTYDGPIKGVVVFPGIVEGAVKIIAKMKDVWDMKEGEILVAAMTMPDMVIAMRKAAAIVTDEGGILCHAAIVSRELGIPCIIATERATKVLKDGDKVRVDANKGIVEKVNI